MARKSSNRSDRLRSNAIIDLVVTQDSDGKYHASGGPREAIFGGSGNSSDEAIGAWFRQNRECANFQVSFVIDGEFSASTKYGVGRSKEELGPSELKALQDLETSNTMTDGINDKRPIKPVAGPVLTAKPLFVEDMPVCETCDRSYLDATQDEIFYRCEPGGLVRCCECLRREHWDV